MNDKLDDYRGAAAPLPEKNRLWPLYGAGFDNLGSEGSSIEVSMPQPGPDELLVRHDAVGLCFSDIKVIRAGQEHPRIHRALQSDPVVLGHEVSATVVAVGENLRNQYEPGDRFIVQADIYLGGVSYAYGYEIQGGLSLYNIIDWRVLNGDHGNYLIPVQPSTGYAESALTEPWACVIAAYQLDYRMGLKPGGTTWIIGTQSGRDRSYTISQGFDEVSHPDRLLLSQVPEAFADWLKERARALGIETIKVNDVTAPPVDAVDDIVLLGADPRIVSTTSPHLAKFGVYAILTDVPFPDRVEIDLGRVHYDRWVYVGSPDPDVARAYREVPVHSTLQPGGKAWFVGAGGPMGRMHVQRALQASAGPATILCTDISDLRLADLCTSFSAEAAAKGIEWICLNPLDKAEYEAGLAAFEDTGFDNIVVLAPAIPAIAQAAGYLSPKGVMNVFAGLARGTFVPLDLNDVVQRSVRVIGHSASTIEDLRLMLHQTEHGELLPNRSVAAIGSLSAARDGLAAVRDALFPGKVVIFPQIKEFPLTPLPELKDKLPSVYARLKDGREWTTEAEEEFLRLMLP